MAAQHLFLNYFLTAQQVIFLFLTNKPRYQYLMYPAVNGGIKQRERCRENCYLKAIHLLKAIHYHASK